MRILVITRNAWDDSNSIGNTISNFFQGLPDIEFANIYFRSAKPNNKLCKRYYQVTETDVLKHWFVPSKIGRFFVSDEMVQKVDVGKISGEKKIISFIHKHNIRFLNKLSNHIWNRKKWINNKLDSFITSFSPDIVFSFVKALPQYFQTIKHLREKYRTPLFTWIADDEYTGYLKCGDSKRIDRLRYILKASAEVRGCSQEICGYYNSVFGCDATPLYKSCDLSDPLKAKTNEKITMVYAGNLLLGRLDVVRWISDELESYQIDGRKEVSFEIYSSTYLSSSDINAYFGKNKHTSFLGAKNYEFIKERLSTADIVLHAESFDEKQIIKTRYSFSTKIIDCLQSGSVILAVGPGEISSIKYIKKIPGAFVIDRVEAIKTMLPSLLNDSAHFKERTEETREFALRNHDSKIISGELYKSIESIVIC